MRRCLLLLSLLLPLISPGQVLIKNVNVVDVEKKKILEGYNVVALDGKIISVDKGKTYKLPEGTTVIDGTGKWLVPGYCDAHVHFFQDGGLHARPDVIDLRKYRPYDVQINATHDMMEDFLRRYMANGITSVIDVGSSYHFLRQRDSFMLKPYAPIIRMTGPLLTTYVPPAFKNLGDESPFALMETEAGVRQSVRDQLPLHADFIKIWYIVQDKDKEAGARKNLPLVQAVIDEAHKNHLRVAVHATERITAQLAIESGADFLVHSVDDELISDAFVQLLKTHKTVLCPTLVVAANYERALGDQYHLSTSELNTDNPMVLGTLLDYPYPDTALGKNIIAYLSTSARKAGNQHEDSVMKANLNKLVQSGVTIATGTDAGNIGTQHVSSLFDELAAMQSAGMNTWQLLEATTLNGARAVGEDSAWGSIAKNKKANMLLLDANPVDNLANWRRINRVIHNGIPYDPSSFVSNTPEQLVQQQLNAYNAHDLEAFLAPYADDVELYSFPNTLESRGKEAMRKDYQFITRMPELYCRILRRSIYGNRVIDEEEVTITGDKKLHALVIYETENGKIKRVYFIQ